MHKENRFPWTTYLICNENCMYRWYVYFGYTAFTFVNCFHHIIFSLTALCKTHPMHYMPLTSIYISYLMIYSCELFDNWALDVPVSDPFVITTKLCSNKRKTVLFSITTLLHLFLPFVSTIFTGVSCRDHKQKSYTRT